MSETLFYKNGRYLTYTDPVTGQLQIIPDQKYYSNDPYWELEDPTTKQLTRILKYKQNSSYAITPILTNFKSAVAGVKTGTRRATVLIVGDSTTSGLHAGDSGSDFSVNSRNRAWPNAFASALTAAGIPALCNSVMGDSGLYKYSASFATSMSNYSGNASVIGSGGDASRVGLGGSPFIMNASGLYTAVTPPTNVNTAKFLFQSPTVATFNTQVGSGPVSVASPDGSDGALNVITASLSGAAAPSQGCAAGWKSGGAVAIQGFYAYDSASPAVDVINAGISGSVAADWAATNTAHAYLNGIKALAPDLTIIMARINDMDAGTDLTAFSASLSAVVTEAAKYGDVLLVNDAAVNNGASGVASKAVSDTYTAAIKQVASLKGLPPVTDLEASLGVWNVTDYYDSLHPLKAKHILMGQKIASDVLSYIT